MSTEMEFNEQLHVGDLVVVKSKEEIDDLKDDGGNFLPWVSESGDKKSTLSFTYTMRTYCGVTMEVDSVRTAAGHDDDRFVYYTLRLPKDTEIEYLENDKGKRLGRRELDTDLRSWAWIPSMLKWPDDFREEEIIGIDADSLFESLLV